jgi:hypothetical protein
MKIKILLFFIFAFSVSEIHGQKRFVYGKIISEDLETLSGIRIQNADTLILATTDNDGKFKIEIPIGTNQLIISGLGWEWTTIDLATDCNNLELILMNSVIYDYISAKKVGRLRKKRFDKLPEIYRMAFEKGIFLQKSACFNQQFVPTLYRTVKIKKEVQN